MRVPGWENSYEKITGVIRLILPLVQICTILHRHFVFGHFQWLVKKRELIKRL